VQCPPFDSSTCGLVPELLAYDAFVEAVAGIEQHVHGDPVIHLDVDRQHVSHLVVVRALSGNSAPRQRRGRNGLIGVSAISCALIGMIGPWAERL